MVRESVQGVIDKIASSENEIELNLKLERIDPEEAWALAGAIKKAKNPVNLNLYGNNIGDEGAKVLAEAIAVASVSVPVTLNLSYNKIGDEGAKALAGAITVASVPVTLDLSYNKIGDEGAKALAGAIAVAIVPINLNLWNNNIGAEGAKALAEAIAVAIVPINLNLWKNNVGDEGLSALAGAVKEAKHPVTITFFESDMGDEKADDLDVALRINKIKFKEHPVNSMKEFLSTVTFQGNLVNAIANYKVPEITEEKINKYLGGYTPSVSKEQASKILARTLLCAVEAPFSSIPIEVRELIPSKIEDGEYLENLVLQVCKEIKHANSNATAVGEASGGEENMEVVATDENPDDNSGGGDAKKPSDSLSSDSSAEAQEATNATTNIFYAESPKELVLRPVDTVEELSGKAKEYEESIQELEELQEKGHANITFSQFPELDIPEKAVEIHEVLGGMVAVGS